MALYEIDTLSKAIKKYVVTMGIGFCLGAATLIYMNSCTNQKYQRLDAKEQYKHDLEQILKRSK